MGVTKVLSKCAHPPGERPKDAHQSAYSCNVRAPAANSNIEMTMPAELDGDQHLDDGPLLETRNQLNLTEERQTSHMPVSHHSGQDGLAQCALRRGPLRRGERKADLGSRLEYITL